jgi:hypothetical protein
VSGYVEHLYTQLVTTGNYNSLTSLRTLVITATAAHTNSSVFTSRFLVTDPTVSSANALTGWRISDNSLIASTVDSQVKVKISYFTTGG